MNKDENLEQLLTDMRMGVTYTDKVTMPIPLYERIKAYLKENLGSQECWLDIKQLEKQLAIGSLVESINLEWLIEKHAMHSDIKSRWICQLARYILTTNQQTKE